MDASRPDVGHPAIAPPPAAPGFWGSYRALPRGWQVTVGVLVVLLLGAASGARSGDAASDNVLASTRAEYAQAADGQRAAQGRVAQLRSEIGSLREQLASARLRNKAAAEDAARIARLQQRVAALAARVELVKSERRTAEHEATKTQRQLAVITAELDRLRKSAKTAAPETTDVTKPEPPVDAGDCHPSYRGDCLPVTAVDVDCAGGAGDGPIYADKVKVVGTDVFGLDADGDGWACE